MNIKILGTNGCKNCEDLYDKIKELVSKKGYNITLEKITSILEISKYGVTSIPGLVIDGKVVLEGIVPSDNDLICIIENQDIAKDMMNEAKCDNGICKF